MNKVPFPAIFAVLICKDGATWDIAETLHASLQSAEDYAENIIRANPFYRVMVMIPHRTCQGQSSVEWSAF